MASIKDIDLINTQMPAEKHMSFLIQEIVKVKVKLSRNRPWRPIGL
jgi:hypothetical protein